jgi:LuxR family maltose regulon positive regulatory protein
MVPFGVGFAGSWEGRMTATAFTTATAVPCLPTRWLSRQRLLDQLDATAERAFTLISAPPGTGKTTVAADWVWSRLDGRAAWITVDGRHNDPRHMVRAVCASLAELDAEPPAVSPSRVGLWSLPDVLLAMPRPAGDVVIVLDDAQELTNRSVWAAIERLAFTSPSWLHVVVVTRADPPFGLRRLQLQGRLSQVRQATLAFDDAEAADLLAMLGLHLPSERVAALVRWAEGWAAGLCLAAQAISEHTAPEDFLDGLRAGETLVADLLVEEVLDRLGSADRQFLLRTSVADRLSAELAELLTDRGAAGQRLQELERAGTFLVAADPARGWYRYHGLMSTLLRARLYEQDPALAERLLSVATRWYAERGLEADAERHGARAGEWDIVGDLRVRRLAVEILQTGDVGPGIEDAPPSAIEDRPSLQLLAAADAIRTGDAERARTMLEETRPMASGALAPVTACLDVMRGRAFGFDSSARESLAWLERSNDADLSPNMEPFVALVDAEVQFADANLATARRRLAAVVGSSSTPMWANDEARALLATVDAVEGHPERAAGWRAALGDVLDDGALAWTRLSDVVCHALRGATGPYRAGVSRLSATTPPRSRSFEECARVVRAAAAAGPGPRAPLVDPPPAKVAKRVLVALGVMETTDASGVAHPTGSAHETALLRARRAASHSAWPTVAHALESVTDASDVHPRTAVEARVLMSLFHLHRCQEEDAVRWLEAALDVPAVRSPLLEWGSALRPLVERHAWKLSVDHADLGELADLLRVGDTPSCPAPLTDRERAILHYLPTLMSNAEIASELFVSVNTVKTHLKAIYRKLGVTRRREALLRARQLALV